MKRLPIIALLILSTLFARAAAPTGNIPISAMPEATNALDSAYIPIIQPYPGRTTNDNFKVSVASLFDARPQAIITNLTVYNFTVISNFFSTTTNITAYEITVTNNISHDRIFISTNITINGFDINTWTNDNQIFHPTINRGAGPLDYSFLVASNIVRVDDGRMSGTETWVSKSVALNVGNNQLPVAGNSQWNLIGPTSNPDDTTISLMNGITDAQKLVIYNITNAVPANGAFKLTNGTPIPDSISGGIVQLMRGRDWVATNGSWIALEFHSPNWVESDDRNVFTGAGGADTWHIVNGILQPVDLTLPVEVDSSLIWGPGLTNVSYRNGTSLVYTNSDNSGNPVSLKVGTPLGEAAFSAAGNTARVQGANAVDLFDSTRTVRWGGGQLFPTVSGMVLGGINGSLNTAWADLELDRAYYQYGYHDNTGTNYARLKVSFPSTNSAVILDSEAAGIAGDPLSVMLRFGGTNRLQIQQLGGIMIGPNTSNFWANSLNGATLVHYANSGAGDDTANNMGITLDSTDGSDFESSYSTLNPQNYSDIFLNSKSTVTYSGKSASIELKAQPFQAFAQIKESTGGRPVFTIDGFGGVASPSPFFYNFSSTFNGLAATNQLARIQYHESDVFTINVNGSITAGSTNRWSFKSVTEGATTNLVINVNGKDYTFQAW